MGVKKAPSILRLCWLVLPCLLIFELGFASSQVAAQYEPALQVDISDHWVYGFGWPNYSELTLTIDDHYIDRAVVESNPQPVVFDLRLTHLQPGMLVKLTDGVTAKSLKIADFSVMKINVSANAILGNGTPGARLDVCAKNAPGKSCWHSTVNAIGMWTALPADSKAFALKADTGGAATEFDEDGDSTYVIWNSPSGREFVIRADAESNFYYLGGGVMDRNYPLTIARPSDPDLSVYSTVGTASGPIGDVDFPMEGYDLQIGDVITVNDGFTTRSLVIAPPGTINLDVDTNIASGTVRPGQRVLFWSSTIPWRFAKADDSGHWSVDVSKPGQYDNDNRILGEIASGASGMFGEADADWDITWYVWRIPEIMAIYPSENLAEVDQDVTMKLTFFNPADGDKYSILWDWGDGTLSEDLQPGRPHSSAAHQYRQPGVYTITATVRSSNGRVSETEHCYGQVVYGAMAIRPPEKPVRVDQAVTMGLTFDNPAAGVEHTILWDWGDGTTFEDLQPGQPVATATHQYNQAGIYNISATLRNSMGQVSETKHFYGVDVYGLSSIRQPENPVRVDQAVTVGLTFNNPAADVKHTILWDWGDGTTFEDPQPSLPDASATHQYHQPGIYTITTTIRSVDGRLSETKRSYNLVVSGPGDGVFVGEGWFNSPEGASPTTPGLGEQANFMLINAFPGILSAPVGLVMFNAGNLAFVSSSFEWLVVTGANLQLKGGGTINGKGAYTFILNASNGANKIRIKIWNTTTGLVVYDNQPGADDFAEPETAIGGGFILIP
jgi:PKD repeat protein